MAPVVPWPYSQEPVTIAYFDDHRMRMGVASYADLDSLADFCTEYSWIVKQETGVLALDQLVNPGFMTSLMKERYKYSLKAIMDCCIPGSMTGIVLKIEYQGLIRGVNYRNFVESYPLKAFAFAQNTGSLLTPSAIVALNIVSAEFNDPWSQNERQEQARPQVKWIFPDDYMGTLSYTLWDRGNHGRPVLNVPYFVVSLEQPYLNACIPAFGRMLIKLYTWFNATTVVNIQTGPYHATFDPYFSGSTFIHTATLLENAPSVTQRNYTYSVYTSWARPSQEAPLRYLDDVVRRAFDMQ
ncbi:hypothetical protein GQX73_g7313 [Xylaria multiplex]|uniref:Uncharacterized protein n=1 Tax=Xylaria multiplex TaxID=323545 RepID=A0A7C8ITT1_9PEZI|nr:hypothetical protein GQX73_g7313 [Xylaria multiplex]